MLLSFILNLIFNAEIFALAIIALILNLCVGLTIWVFVLLLALWIVIALLITLGLGFVTKNTPKTPEKKNVNPYSKSTKEYLSDKDDEE